MKLIWTAPAVAHLDAIREYIESESSAFYAERFVQRIVMAPERLVDFPLSGRTPAIATSAPSPQGRDSTSQTESRFDLLLAATVAAAYISISARAAAAVASSSGKKHSMRSSWRVTSSGVPRTVTVEK